MTNHVRAALERFLMPYLVDNSSLQNNSSGIASAGLTPPRRRLTPLASDITPAPGIKRPAEAGEQDTNTLQPALQPYENARPNIELARRTMPQTQALEAAIVKDVPGAITAQSPYRLKTEDRIREKAQEEVEKSGGRLTLSQAVRRMADLDGIRVGIRNIADLRELEKVFKDRGYDIAEKEDKISQPDPATGYRALHYKIRDHQTGALKEVQAVPSEVEKVQERTHALYKKLRKAKRAGEPPDAAEKRAGEKAESIFNAAWERQVEDGFLIPRQSAGGLPLDHVISGKREADVTFASPEQAAFYHVGKNLAHNTQKGYGPEMNRAVVETFAKNNPEYVEGLRAREVAALARDTFNDVRGQVAQSKGDTINVIDRVGSMKG